MWLDCGRKWEHPQGTHMLGIGRVCKLHIHWKALIYDITMLPPPPKVLIWHSYITLITLLLQFLLITVNSAHFILNRTRGCEPSGQTVCSTSFFSATCTTVFGCSNLRCCCLTELWSPCPVWAWRVSAARAIFSKGGTREQQSVRMTDNCSV